MKLHERMTHANLLVLCPSGEKFPIWTETNAPDVEIGSLNVSAFVEQHTIMLVCQPAEHRMPREPNAHCLCTGLGIINLSCILATSCKVSAVRRKAHTADNTEENFDSNYLKIG
jgi:hypothetical protein